MTESIEYFLFRALNGVARRLSFRAAGKAGAALGNAAFRFTRIRKRVTRENLAKAFPGLSLSQVDRIARGAYENYGTALFEMFWAGGQTAEDLLAPVQLVNREVIDNAHAHGKGVILLSGHFGSWELLVSSLRLHLGQPLVIIVQHQRNRRIDALIDRGRSRFGNTTVPMGPSVRDVLKALKDGRIVAMLGDQSGPKESVFIDFFGRPAATHRGPAAFSLKTGAPIVMAFLVRRKDRRYDVYFEEVSGAGLDTYSDANVLELTRRHVAVLERFIRLYPDHWLWMHKRWKHTEFYATHIPLTEAVK
jgi:Kdo2-lipid IVA lauroyltransferase/acyltransferase